MYKTAVPGQAVRRFNSLYNGIQPSAGFAMQARVHVIVGLGFAPALATVMRLKGAYCRKIPFSNFW